MKLALLAKTTLVTPLLTSTKTTGDDGTEISSTVLGKPSELNWSSLNPRRGVLDRRKPGVPGIGVVHTYTPHALVTSNIVGQTYSKS
jgi:hypothetical protein